MKRKKFKKPEIMAPAGDRISLRAALDAGADAIYFGVGNFNMRANAGNFSIRQMGGVVRTAHEYGAKAYLTLNTIVLPGEVKKLEIALKAAVKARVDAIVAWDFSVIQMAREAGLEVFISTQMSVANAPAILFFFRELEIRRFVLARECSLKDIQNIRKNLVIELGKQAEEIELEVFAHGAMCLSISGRCQLSQFTFGASANRGACRQPCRREFDITETRGGNSFKLGANYVLSPKDLCTLPFLEKILKAGVSSLKLEGRQRSSEYVATVTKAYRRLVDLWFDSDHTRDFPKLFAKAKSEEVQNLEKVFNRGFSSGFYLGRPLDEWSGIGGSQATHKKTHIGEVLNYYKRSKVVEILLNAGNLAIGDEVSIHGPTSGVVSTKVETIEINNHRLKKAKKGSKVGVAFPHLVRKGDKVYRIIPILSMIRIKANRLSSEQVGGQ